MTDSPNGLRIQLGRLGIYALADALAKLGVGGAVDCLRPMTPRSSFLGPAFPVQFRDGPEPGGRGYQTGALIDSVPVGAVLIMEAGGTRYSVVGDMAICAAMRRGLQAVVINGCVRDVDEIARLDIPVFARGDAIRSGLHRVHVAGAGVAIELDGVPISPGDLVVGGSAGLVVIPPGALDETIRIADQACQRDAETLAALGGSESAAQIWQRIRGR
jgi:4-hydroxy-4-methyl-2-oxoglutarate aldolase